MFDDDPIPRVVTFLGTALATAVIAAVIVALVVSAGFLFVAFLKVVLT